MIIIIIIQHPKSSVAYYYSMCAKIYNCVSRVFLQGLSNIAMKPKPQ